MVFGNGKSVYKLARAQVLSGSVEIVKNVFQKWRMCL